MTTITRSVVGRTHSAAELAALRGDLDRAERYVAEALAGAPPSGERALLEDLREWIAAERVKRGQA
jgi:hypothetical protein